MSHLFRLASLAASLTLAVPLLAQSAVPAPAEPDSAVEGDTPDRVSMVNQCPGHKFETMVEIDAVKHRSTRVKLCSKPGATDAEWVRTLHAAIAQFEMRNMAPAARAQVIAELQAELAKYDPGAAPGPEGKGGLAALNLGKGSFADTVTEPEAPFRVTSLPPMPTPKGIAVARSASTAKQAKPIRVTVKCLSRGESGKGGTCDFFDKNSVLVMTAGSGLEKGATMRFLRKGEERATVDIAALDAGQTQRVALPSATCRGVSSARIEIQLVAPGSTTPGATLGPFGLRC